MELYVKVIFWMMLIGATTKLFTMAGCSYPRTETKGLGADLVGFIEYGVLAVWAGIILFG